MLGQYFTYFWWFRYSLLTTSKLGVYVGEVSKEHVLGPGCQLENEGVRDQGVGFGV